VPEAQSGGAEGLQGELTVQLAQQRRHVPGTGRHVGVQHGVRDPPPGALAEESAQRHHQVRGVGADQPEQRQPAVAATGSPQQPGEQREQLQPAGRQPFPARCRLPLADQFPPGQLRAPHVSPPINTV
jgi:hypothetical protein